MTIRKKLILYLIVLHIVIAISGAWLLWENFRPYIFLLEFLLVISMLVGLKITRSYDVHLEIVSAGTEFIRERDFSHTFGEVPASDINNLILMYNEMINKLREERIKGEERQAFLQKILNATPIGVITLDFNGNVDIINSSAYGLLEVDFDYDLVNKKFTELKSPLIAPISEISSGQSGIIKLHRRKQVKCIHSQYFDKGFAKSFYMISDVTEELWKSEKEAYEKLIRILSHEVNNTIGPTNSILQSCIYYSKQLNDEDRIDFENALGVAIDRTNNLNDFMQNYADVVRLPDPVLQELYLDEILKNICVLMEADCHEHNISLEYLSNSSDVLVNLDQKQFEHAIVNIVRNSIDAIGDNGKIDIILNKLEFSKIQVKVVDNGSGISQEAKENLFTPFYSTKENGQGIGLTLVQEIFNRHKFNFSLESKNGLTEFLIEIE